MITIEFTDDGGGAELLHPPPSLSTPLINNSSIYKFGLSVCLFFVCLFVSNKRQNGRTDRAQVFCGSSRDPKEGLWMIKFSKICLHQNSIFENLIGGGRGWGGPKIVL